MTNTESKVYSLGQVAQTVGFSKQTIKKYVKLGYVACSRNQINNYRVFTQDAVDTLVKIKMGQYETPKR